MAFEDFRRERAIRRVLKSIARQRVAIMLPHGGPWVIENTGPRFDGWDEALRTCELRGWVQLLHGGVPHHRFTEEELADFSRIPMQFAERADIYRLTEAGWAALNRTHDWLLATFGVAAATLVATLVAVWLTWIQTGRP